MSLIRRIQDLASERVPFDEAERLIKPHLRDAAPEGTGAERMRAEKREWAAMNGMAVEADIAREGRLSRWLGLDIRPPASDD